MTVIAQVSAIFKYREAARLLAWRDLQVRYSNSVLGVVWSLLYPLLLTFFFTLVFRFIAPNPIPNYPVFFLSALLPWNFFSLSLVAGAAAITNNGHLINRVGFPREILPLSVVLSNAVNFVIALLPLGLIMALFGVAFTTALLWLPVLLIVQLTFILGLTLALSALNVYYRDIQQIVEVLMLPAFFLTPIIYDYATQPAASGLARLALVLNPMAGLVTQYRQVVYAGHTPDFSLLLLAAGEALLALLAGLMIFRRLQRSFADEL